MDGHTQGSCNIDFVGSAVKTYVCKQSALIFVLCKYSFHGKYNSSWADREHSFRVRVVLKAFFNHQSILQRVVRTSPEKRLDPRGPIAS